MLNQMKKLTALPLLLPVLASADPGAATRWLINEPANLLDIGMMRVNQDLDENESGHESDYRAVTKADPVREMMGADYLFLRNCVCAKNGIVHHEWLLSRML